MLSRNCDTCIYAEETDLAGCILCDREESPNYEEKIPKTSWCKYYEEA